LYSLKNKSAECTASVEVKNTRTFIATNLASLYFAVLCSPFLPSLPSLPFIYLFFPSNCPSSFLYILQAYISVVLTTSFLCFLTVFFPLIFVLSYFINDQQRSDKQRSFHLLLERTFRCCTDPVRLHARLIVEMCSHYHRFP
jgi:hypothetical protein